MDPFGMVISKNEDFPYKHFIIRCIKKDVAILDLNARRLNFKFEIGPGYAKLLPNSDPKITFLSQIN